MFGLSAPLERCSKTKYLMQPFSFPWTFFAREMRISLTFYFFNKLSLDGRRRKEGFVSREREGEDLGQGRIENKGPEGGARYQGKEVFNTKVAHGKERTRSNLPGRGESVQTNVSG